MELIRILHAQKHMNRFLLLAEFFKVCGFFVQEILYGWDVPALTERYYDTKIRIIGPDGEGRDGDLEEEVVIEMPENIDFRQHDIQKVFISHTLHDIGKLYQYDEINELEKISQVFIDHDLGIHNHDLRYFYIKNRIDCNQARQNFEQAIAEFMELESDRKKASKYLRYCRINCEFKVNMLCDVQSMERYYSPRDLIDELADLFEDYQDFYMAYTLMGRLAEMDRTLKPYADEYYKYAIRYEKRKYNGYIYYRLGRYYEKEMGDYKEALACYKIASEIDETNYRAWFKVGSCNFRLGNNDLAMEIYKNTCRLLLQDEKSILCLEPLQLEYLIKMNRKRVLIFEDSRRILEAREAVKEGIRICNTIADNEFFMEYYEDGMAEERKALMKTFYVNDWLIEELRMLDMQLAPFEK